MKEMNSLDDVRRFLNGVDIWRLTSSYNTDEEEYGRTYTVGLFLTEDEARSKAKDLGLRSYIVGVFTYGDIIVRGDRNKTTQWMVEEEKHALG